ncbi:hypothetical protein NUW58_g8224 [Xylaria curta]|uniref:Uncharacterized protein n=1 Tax=Xylaria curta TaxID=42375 RepID=A0ACC1N9D8_9PEZI|nr:hypothetical protein NUW58_g8224 [Xylaria curta]
MHVDLILSFRRGLFYSSVSRGKFGGLSNLVQRNSNPIRPATTTSQATSQATSPTTRPHGHHTTDAISIKSVGSAGYRGNMEYTGYMGFAPLNAPALNPLASNFSPLQQNQPAYGLPLGDAMAVVPYHLASQTPVVFPTTNQNSNAKAKATRPSRHQDKISQPSPESGGVPDPTPEYLLLASHPPFLLPQPRNLLVVVDLNGTLLHRPNRRSPTHFVERPYARSFISYCINTFTVVIWSSARPENVRNMCRQLLSPEDRAKVVAVWARDNFGLSSHDYNQRVQVYKRLTRLWDNPVIAASHPMAASGKKWSQLNTVLVDDSIEKARSEPFNLLQIPEFSGSEKEPGFVLPQVHDYLNECSQQANVSAYMKTQPFKIKPEFTL